MATRTRSEAANRAAALIEEIRASASAESLAKESYPHPNGFDKLVLGIETELQRKAVLHVWWANRYELNRPERPHTHRWDFSTHVLVGAYSYEIFVEDPEGEVYSEFLYSNVNSDLHFQRRTRLRPLEKGNVRQGSSYSLNCETIHTVLAESAVTTITLFDQVGVGARNCRVYVPGNGITDFLDMTNPFSITDYLRKLERVGELLRDV